MWIVYNREDSWEWGWQVDNETEAITECLLDENLTYIYIAQF